MLSPFKRCKRQGLLSAKKEGKRREQLPLSNGEPNQRIQQFMVAKDNQNEVENKKSPRGKLSPEDYPRLREQ
jgi:hypothetical protein